MPSGADMQSTGTRAVSWWQYARHISFGIVPRSALTAKADQLEPYGYIKYLLDHIGTADTLEKWEALLPWQVPMEPFSKKVNVFDGGNRRI